MTPEDLDKLVHSRVMGQEVDIPCDGYAKGWIVRDEDPLNTYNNTGLWHCSGCGYLGSGQATPHTQPDDDMPDYSTSLDAAWLIVRHFASLPDEPFEPYWRKRLFMHTLDILPCSNEVFYDITFSMLASLTPEKICQAALEAMAWKHEVKE